MDLCGNLLTCAPASANYNLVRYKFQKFINEIGPTNPGAGQDLEGGYSKGVKFFNSQNFINYNDKFHNKNRIYQ